MPDQSTPAPDGPRVHVAITYGDEGHPTVTVDGLPVPADHVTVELIDPDQDEHECDGWGLHPYDCGPDAV